MSRRSGQSGSIQKDGRWYVVRYWKDVVGQEKRQRVREKICPISGPGKLSASERERKAKEIIAASGVDTQEYFDRVVTQSAPGVIFRQQAATWAGKYAQSETQAFGTVHYCNVGVRLGEVDQPEYR